MQKACLTKVLESFQKITNDGDCLLLWKFASLFDKSFQITLIAELSDNVTVVCCTVNIMAFEDVWMIQLFQGINFAFEHFFLRFTLDTFDIDDFNRNLLSWLFIDAFVDNRAETLTNDVLQPVWVILNFFSQVIIRIEMSIHSLL